VDVGGRALKRRVTTPGTATKRWATSVDESDHTEATMAHVRPVVILAAGTSTVEDDDHDDSNGDDEDEYDAGIHRVDERGPPHRRTKVDSGAASATPGNIFSRWEFIFVRHSCVCSSLVVRLLVWIGSRGASSGMDSNQLNL
jgi:hypothetical protein